MKIPKQLRIVFLMAVLAFLGSFLFPGTGEAKKTEKKLSAITAVYMGDTVLVGHSIDLDELTVMGLYSDGSYVKLKDYSLSTYVVKNAGENEIRVSYDGISTTLVVKGKKLQFMNAYYGKNSVTVGEQLERDEITVYAFYTDGTNERVTNYTLASSWVTQVGTNEFFILYEGETVSFTVLGREVKKVKTLYANYVGAPVVVGNAPKRDDFYVSVSYNDGSMERITGFEISPSIVQKEGSNTVVVSYAGLSEKVTIEGLAKTVVSIQAEYTGLPVVVGKTVAPEDIKVTAVFNDNTKDTVTNFTLSGSVIYNIGDNVITVFCGQATAYISVRGVEAEIIDYSNGVEAFVRSGSYYSRINIAVDAKANTDAITVTKVNAKQVQKAVQRVVKTEEYLAYEVSFANPEMDLHLPMTVKVTVPEGFDKESFAVFYTTNRKTILAQMNGEFLKDGAYEFKMFQPGTYIIADCTEWIYTERIELDEPEITLRTGRNYSLDPTIYPRTATSQEVTFTSSRPHIVTVDENGLLEAQKLGAAVITVEAQDGSGVTCKLLVYVIEGRNEFADEIAALNERLGSVETEEDFMEFLTFLSTDCQKKKKRWNKEKYQKYEEELRIWRDGMEDYLEDKAFDWEGLIEMLEAEKMD